MRLISTCVVLFALLVPASTMVDSMRQRIMSDNIAGDLNQWQRIDFRSGRTPPGTVSQIRIAIQTTGPRMSGLIRITGAPASNFNTGNGTAIVDLMNVGDRDKGYADIVAAEIAFAEATKGQPFSIKMVSYE